MADYAIHKRVAADEILVYTPEYILTHVDTVQWIIPQWLHTTGQLILSSAPGVGKTQLALQLAYCLTVGQRFLNMEIAPRHRVLFMSLEMDKQSLKYILSHQKTNWDRIPEFNIIDEAGTLVQYENLIVQYESTVVIVDSLTELFDDTVDNPNAEARRVMRWCRKVRRRYGCGLILIHHNRKATEGNRKPKGLSDLAGSFQFGKDSDTVIQLWEDHRGLEISGVKVRFGPKTAFMLERSSSLWYTRKGGEDDSNGPKPIQPVKDRDSGKFGFRH
jgi:RecA-family ATPase